MSSASYQSKHSPEIEEIINRLSKEYDINLVVCREAVCYMFRGLRDQISQRTLKSVRFLNLGTWGVSFKKYKRYKKSWGIS